MADLTAIILTKNEEQNIMDCIDSIKNFASRIVLIDSGRTDRTIQIAKDMGAEIYVHPFENYARQFNWGIDNISITSKWILRIDADERFTPELCEELEKLLKEHENDEINGVVLEAWLFFMGKRLKHGGSRKKKLMVFKTGFGRIEDRKMDEHTLLTSGKSIEARHKFLHYDYKDLTTFIKKLNWYATREMQDYFDDRFVKDSFDGTNSTITSTRRKKSRYYKMPMFLRCWLYYFYCLFIKGNIFNGREGRIYCFLYHFYYRWLVDAKIYEQKKNPKPFENTGDLK